MINWAGLTESTPFVTSKRRRLSALAFICGVIITLLYLSITSWFPQDIGTTAKYIDALGLQPALDGTDCFSFFCAGGFAEDVVDVSAGSAQMSLGIALFQMLSGFMIAVSGLSWGKTKSPRTEILGVSMLLKSFLKKELDLTEFNYIKLMYVIMWIAVASVDTFTDVAYRNGQNQSMFILVNAFITSLFFYNLGSEFVIVSGTQLLAHYGAELASEVFGGVSMKQRSSKKTKTSHTSPRKEQPRRNGNGSHARPQEQTRATTLPPFSRREN